MSTIFFTKERREQENRKKSEIGQKLTLRRYVRKKFFRGKKRARK